MCTYAQQCIVMDLFEDLKHGLGNVKLLKRTGNKLEVCLSGRELFKDRNLTGIIAISPLRDTLTMKLKVENENQSFFIDCIVHGDEKRYTINIENHSNPDRDKWLYTIFLFREANGEYTMTVN